MIFSIVSAICGTDFSEKIIINSFGATNDIPEYLEKDANIDDLPIPVREDGAMFKGWYYSLNFDEKFRAVNENKSEYIILNARYDKNYCFTLRYDVLGCFGLKNNDSTIHYFIPKGKYMVMMTDFSKAKEGSINVVVSDHYSMNNGVVNLRQYDFNKIGEEQIIILNEDEHIMISSDSVFLFQRVDVDPKFISFRLDY